MIRATFYVAVAGAVWMTEGFLFAHYLRFGPWQVVAMAMLYTVLFAAAVRAFLGGLRTDNGTLSGSEEWRILTLAPMLVVIIGSFASLPVLLAILAIGKIV